MVGLDKGSACLSEERWGEGTGGQRERSHAGWRAPGLALAHRGHRGSTLRPFPFCCCTPGLSLIPHHVLHTHNHSRAQRAGLGGADIFSFRECFHWSGETRRTVTTLTEGHQGAGSHGSASMAVPTCCGPRAAFVKLRLASGDF